MRSTQSLKYPVSPQVVLHSEMELRKIEECKMDCARKFFSKITSDQVKYDARKQLREVYRVGKTRKTNAQLFDETFEQLPSSPIVESGLLWTARASVAANDTSWHSCFAQLLPEFPKVQPLHWQSFQTIPTKST